ncbi:autophagy protein 12-like [Patiria miniata]|uniref:Ubiquitin-like protein ATG12 n=1 Tax=Patiria miniata TaxID=46514 RepID=A0A914AUT6_PATMI|nr:autophagy protein 12-like [Patiria miniata]XP_038067846.1 autophagy protein 12-like [Patiria miniata]
MAETESGSKTDQRSEDTSENGEPVQPQQDKSKEDATVTSPAKKKNDKVDVLLKNTADAPIMAKKKWAVPRTRKVSWVIEFIRKYFKCEQTDSLFLYVNQAFAPAPDQEIGNLFECYGSDGKLVLHYCMKEAWG